MLYDLLCDSDLWSQIDEPRHASDRTAESDASLHEWCRSSGLGPNPCNEGPVSDFRGNTTSLAPGRSAISLEPYDYGPCSFQVYKDLEALEHHGLVQATKVLGRTWSYYSLTGTGEGLAIELSSTVDPRASRYFATVREFVTRLPFRKLLNAIYERYPDYAVNSVFR